VLATRGPEAGDAAEDDDSESIKGWNHPAEDQKRKR
jgi:hypothetical protein